ncbi:MAG: hypothetical protein U5P41_07175 [Gammaproteobacteria bacterium]|nr:hypothetical protein [Gammaproteobacteria bacterium]
MTLDADARRCLIGVWRVTGQGAAVPDDSDSAGAASGTGLTLTVDVPEGAVVVAGQSNGEGGNTISWSGGAEQYNVALDNNSQFSGAHVEPAASDRTGHEITTSHASDTEGIAAVAAVWNPAPPEYHVELRDDDDNWELLRIGYEQGSPDSAARPAPLASSNGGNAVSFSGGVEAFYVLPGLKGELQNLLQFDANPYALSFDGTNDYVDVGSFGSFHLVEE